MLRLILGILANFFRVYWYTTTPLADWSIERYQTSDKGKRRAWSVNVEKYSKSGLHLPNLMNQHSNSDETSTRPGNWNQDKADGKQ